MSDSGAPAGWYPDPSGRPGQRYWDGTQWTDAAQPPTDTQTMNAWSSTAPAKRAWYDQTWLLVVSLLFCFPVGLFVLWKGHWARNVKIGVTVALAALIVIGSVASAASNQDKTTTAATSPKPNTVPTQAPATTARPRATAPATAAPTTQAPKPTAPKPTAPRAPVETAGQSNARQSAEQYLSMGSGFSRLGLIKQLSSSYGAGFSLADATYGVDATHTDWNAQACLSAKNYLNVQPFSHAGLVQQLSSAYGAEFTPAEAEYGVKCAGL